MAKVLDTVELFCCQPHSVERREMASRSWSLFLRERLMAAARRVINEPEAATSQDQLLLYEVVYLNYLAREFSHETLRDSVMWTTEEVEAAIASAVRPYAGFMRTMRTVFGIVLAEIGLVFVLFLLECVL